MKRFLGLLLAVVMLTMSAVALADTKIDPLEDRKITPKDVGLNEVEEGISPTTGLTLSTLYVPEGFTGMAKTGRYVPMMTQIGNDEGGVGRRAPWGAAYADIVYETLLYRANNATTRMMFLFNDVVPDSVGPIRSMRVTNVWIREEWDAVYMYHGQQTYEGSNAVQEMKNLGHDYIYDPILFNGWAGAKDWDKFFSRRSGIPSPHNRNVNPAGLYNNLVPQDYVFPNHAFKFTDEVPEGDTALDVKINWRSDVVADSNSELIYDVDAGAYLRYMTYSKDGLLPWVDRDEEVQIAFANVIVQFTDSLFNNRRDAPIQRVIGKNNTPAEGNADFFMAGKHVSGYWKRESATDRTVYYGPDGEEISLQRGKTLIVIFPRDAKIMADESAPNGCSVVYSDQLP